MATIIVKTNASQATDVLLKDVGIVITNSGGSETFDTNSDFGIILKLQESEDLRTYLVDDAYGAGSSTIILNDGTSDIAQADAADYLDTVLLPDASNEFGVVKTNEDKEIDDDLDFNGVAVLIDPLLGSDLDADSNKIVNLDTPTAPGDATNKSYVDGLFSSISSGVDWKESVRVATIDILDNNTDISGSPTYNNTGGTSSRGQITATLAVADTFSIDGVALVSNDRVLIKDESGGLGADANGIYYATISGTSLTLDRALDFDEDDEVTDGAACTVDEGTTNVGTGWILSTNNPITIGGASGTSLSFTQFMINTYAAGNGLTFSAGKINVVPAAGSGLIANADNLDTDWGETGDIAALGSAASGGALAEFARADHVHTHGDRGGDGSTSQHDADQIDVEATLARIGAPDDAEAVFGNINTNFGDAKYVGKFHDYGQTIQVPSSGILYLAGGGAVLGSAVGKRMLRAGAIKAAGLQVNIVDATRAYKLSIKINGVEVANVALPTSTAGAHSTSLNAAYVAGDLLSTSIEITTGTGKSTFTNIDATIEIVEG